MKEEHLDHIEYVLPADRYISAIPDYEQFGRKTNPMSCPDLIFDYAIVVAKLSFDLVKL